MASREDEDIWVENSPEPLYKITARVCMSNVKNFTEELTPELLRLRDDVYLPTEVCQAILSTCNEENINIGDNIASIFADNQSTRLKELVLRNSSLTDKGLEFFLGHNLKKIHVHGCERITSNVLEFLNEHSDNLLSLSTDSKMISPGSLLAPLSTSEFSDDETSDDDDEWGVYEKRRYILKAPCLKSLVLQDLRVSQGRTYFNILLKALPNLTHLDLSGVECNQDLRNLKFLLHCPRLIYLVLFNVKEVKLALTTICQLESLEFLDISQFDEIQGDFDDPFQFLEELVRSIPRLRCLDISGTNLDEDCPLKPSGRIINPLCDIPALSIRTENPFEFLGLYRTVHKASRRNNIPALTFSGSHCEEQMLIAAKRYRGRRHVMENILEDLLDLVRNNTARNLKEIMDVTLTAMRDFLNVKKMQRYASALLYYLLPLKGTHDFNIAEKKMIVGIVLDTMEAFKNDTFMMRNGCMVLWQFQVPQDLLYQYRRVIDILLYIGEHYHNGENLGAEGGSYVQRAAVFLLNGLVCTVDNDQKAECGEKIVEAMLRIVKKKLDLKLCDDVMETAWSAMWNVSDETPKCSARFLDMNGMELFLQCKETFAGRLDLLRNMMGLLGNVAEVPTCRRRLLLPDFVSEFTFLLDSQTDGIEVSYNAAGVLSHLASDGEQVWSIATPKREYVLQKLVRAITRWDVSSNRNINYRSLLPIISLLTVRHTPECQLWAAWALANLTRFDSLKYCPLVEEEGGVEQMNLILQQDCLYSNSQAEIYEKLSRYCKMALTNIQVWNKNSKDDVQNGVM